MIVCLGDLLLDVLVFHDSPGAAMDLRGLSVQPGGSAANVAAWLAAARVPVGFIGAVGDDFAGELIVEDLLRRGTRCAVSRHRSAQTGTVLLESWPDGTIRPAAVRGANDLLVLDDDQQALLRSAHWLHCSAYAFYAEPSRAPILAAVAEAHAHGVRVSLDLGAAHLVAHIGHSAYHTILQAMGPDVVLANESEARLLGPADDDPLRNLECLAPFAILKRGALGCELRVDGLPLRLNAPQVTVVDTTGAGDAFAAGAIGALHAGATPRAAAQAGIDTAARCVGLVGGRPPTTTERHASLPGGEH